MGGGKTLKQTLKTYRHKKNGKVETERKKNQS